MGNLNDSIDAIFKGTVFIIFDYVGSLLLLFARPFTGAVSILRKLHAKDANQIRPYVFLFISFIVMFALPPLLSAATQKPDPYQYINYSEQKQTVLRPIYEGIFEQIESKTILAVTIAAVVGVSLFHFGSRAIARGAFRNPARRAIVLDCLFYVGGMQIVLIAVAYVASYFLRTFETDADPDYHLLTDLLGALTSLFSRGVGISPTHSLAAVEAVLLALLLVAPAPIAWRLFRRSRIATASPAAAKPSWSMIAGATLFVLAIDAVTGMAFALAGLVRINIQPLEKPLYRITDVTCEVVTVGNQADVIVQAILFNSGSRQLTFGKNRFSMIFGAKRTEEELEARKKEIEAQKKKGRRPFGDPERIISARLATTMAAPTAPDGLPLLLEPGRASAVRLIASAESSLVAWLNRHPEDQRCTISDEDNWEIGRLGPVQTPLASD